MINSGIIVKQIISPYTRILFNHQKWCCTWILVGMKDVYDKFSDRNKPWSQKKYYDLVYV